VGGRLKFLIGLANADVRFNSFYLDVSPNNDYLRAEIQGEARGSIYGINLGPSAPNGEPFDLGSIFGPINGRAFKNYGAAIDLGAEMKLLDRRLKVSLAVNDLGFINWGRGSSIHGDLQNLLFEYRGYNLNTEEFDITSPEEIKFVKTGNEGYLTMLATTLNVGAEYNFLDNLLGVGLLSHTRFWNKTAYSELTITGTVRPAKWFTAAISHTVIRNKAGIFGLAFNFHPRGVNFFFGMDYIPMKYAQFDLGNAHVPWPLRAKPINFHIGLAFTPGGPSRGW
jgi:hypothetical protein